MNVNAPKVNEYEINERIMPKGSTKKDDDLDEFVNGYWIEPKNKKVDKFIYYLHGILLN